MLRSSFSSFGASEGLLITFQNSLADMVATSLPKLEILITTLVEWENRPQRLDFPVSDEIDSQQKLYATTFFTKCPALHTIAFTGIPEAPDPVGQVPRRVWIREQNELGVVDAQMAGRSALKWKLSEYWRAHL